MSAKQIEVQIMGQSYLLGCPQGGEEKLLAAVGRVDLAMCKIRDAGRIKARDRIAVLAALNLAFDQNDVSPSASPEPEVREPEARLAGLLERLDQALRQDGQLL